MMRRVTAVEWLCLLVGLYLVLRYAWLLDDAYVYFRYADNWVFLGRGLVYNPGEYAEGYTSPAWLLLLSALRLPGVGYWIAVRFLGLICFTVFWWLAVLVNRRLSPRNTPLVNLPLAFLSLNYGVLCYFTSGTEAPLVQLAAAVFVLFAMRPTWRPASYLLPLLPLVRPELALALFAALVWYWVKTKRFPWLMTALSLLFGGGWLLFRILYYADLFPTTFYLKNISDFGQGLRFLHDSFGPYHLYEVFLLGGLALVFAAWRHPFRTPAPDARVFVWIVAGIELLYTVKIGGDARHFRYLAFPVCASVLVLGGLAEGWLGRLLASRPRDVWTATSASAVGLAVALLSFAFLPRQLDAHPAFDLESRPELVDKIADAAHHRLHAAPLSPGPWDSGASIELRPAYDEWLRSGSSDPPGSIRRGPICYRHYMHFDEWAIHSLGLTDAVLARVEMPADRPAHKPGLRPLAVDLQQVIEWWGRSPDRGMYRAAVEAKVAAPWVERNLETLELIERKIYNRHDLWENLVLAMHVGERIDPGPPSGD